MEITIERLRLFLTPSLYSELQKTANLELANTALLSAISFFKSKVPCFNIKDWDAENLSEKQKEFIAASFTEIAKILSYNCLNFIPASNKELKDVIITQYNMLIKLLEVSMGGKDGSICSILKEEPEPPQFDVENFIGISNVRTIRR